MDDKKIHEIKKEQWNDFHTDGQFVTNSSVTEIFKYHNMVVPSNKLILEIGVGHGDFIKTLSQTNEMYGVDVSEKALSVVEPFCKETYFSKDISKIEKVDLAISHLVLQHNHEHEVSRIINDVNLKDDGIFSFQFASLNLEKSVLSKLILGDINKSMLFFYSLEKMREIVNKSNKKTVKIYGPIWFGEPYNFDWYIFQVTKK